MKHIWKGIAGLVLGLALAGQAAAQNVLDDMIYSVKCAGADDKEACKAKARQDFEDHQRSKQGGATTSGTSPATTEKCHDVSAQGPIDVDTAYARAVTTFRFQTNEEKTHNGHRKAFVDDGYKHVRTPGAMYDMWDHLRLVWPARNKTVTFYGSARLMKNGSGAIVEARYCVLREVDPEDYADPAFWQFADESFRRLVQ